MLLEELESQPNAYGVVASMKRGASMIAAKNTYHWNFLDFISTSNIGFKVQSSFDCNPVPTRSETNNLLDAAATLPITGLH